MPSPVPASTWLMARYGGCAEVPADPPEPRDPDSTQEPDTGRAAERTSPATSSGIDLARAMLAAARARAGVPGQQAGDGGGRWARPRRGTGADLRSGSGPDERDPALLATAIDRLVTERGWQTDTAVHGLLARWPQVVGPEVAAHCQPDTVIDGELTVVATSTAWATQLRLLTPQLLARLQEELGPAAIRRVRVRGPQAPSWAHGPRRVRGRGPRDTYG